MTFLFKRKKAKVTRILFATDMHGSEVVWRKFLNASSMLEVNLAIAGGDLTGKMIVPVIEREDGRYSYYFLGENHIIDSSRLEEAFKEVSGIGYYPFLSSEDQVEEMRMDENRVDEVFMELMQSTLKRWLDVIREKLPDDVRVVVCPGNDDRFPVDEIIKDHGDVVSGEGTVIDIDGFHEMISTGWVNPSPWNTTREEEEERLEERLEKYISQLRDVRSAIFNFHAPPYNSNLDEAPLLDEDFKPVLEGGRVVNVPVGSKAVRKVIEKYQPFLGLHGHIHEAAGSMKIGRTHCVNPGSEYAEGILRAFLIEFEAGRNKMIRLQRIEG